MSKYYYYLVAGLPELTLEDSKLSYTVADFKAELYPDLSDEDRRLIDLFYLKFDNANVLKLLRIKTLPLTLVEIIPQKNWLSLSHRLKMVTRWLMPYFLPISPLLFQNISILLPRMIFCMRIVWLRFTMRMQ